MAKYWWVRGAMFVTVIVSVAVGSVAVGSVMTRAGSTASAPVAPTSMPWLTRVAAVESAIAAGDLSRAIYTWHDAYGEAVRSRRWDALADVGDAAVGIDRALRHGQSFRAAARRAYLGALFRARSVGADDGIRRIAAAFAAIGDTEMAEQARVMAPAIPTAQQAGR